VKLKALALVFVVFFAAFATCFVMVVSNSRLSGEKADSIESPSLVVIGNQTIITPNLPIDTPGGPT
jgi:hypothetical protein